MSAGAAVKGVTGAAKWMGKVAPKATGFFGRGKQLATFGRVKPLAAETSRLTERAMGAGTPVAQAKYLKAAQTPGRETMKEVGKGVGLYGGGAAALGGGAYGAHRMLSPQQPKMAALDPFLAGFFDELEKIGEACRSAQE